MISLYTVSHSMLVFIGWICFASATGLTDLCRCRLLWVLLLISSPLPSFYVIPSSTCRKLPDLRFCSFTGSPAAVTTVNRLGELHRLSHLLPSQSLLHGSQSPLRRNLCSRNLYSLFRSESMCSTTAKRPFGVDTQRQADTDSSDESHISLLPPRDALFSSVYSFVPDAPCRLATRLATPAQCPRHTNDSVLNLDEEPHQTSSVSDGKADYGAGCFTALHETLISFWALSKWAISTRVWATKLFTNTSPFFKFKPSRLLYHGSLRQIPLVMSTILLVSVPNLSRESEMKISSTASPSRLPFFLLSGSIEIHLVSRSNIDGFRAVLFRDVVSILKTSFVQPSQVSLISSEILVGARASLVRSASCQVLQLGQINVVCDYFMLGVTYSRMHLKIFHGSPLIEQASLVAFVYLLFCFYALFYVVHPTVEDLSGFIFSDVIV